MDDALSSFIFVTLLAHLLFISLSTTCYIFCLINDARVADHSEASNKVPLEKIKDPSLW
jgi:hypothetical protein